MVELTHEVLDAVDDAMAELRVRADSSTARRLPDETAKLLRETGVMRLLQPARYGGYEVDPRIFNEAAYRLAIADGAVGWVVGVVGVHNYHLGLYADSVQAEVWGQDPDVWISSSYAPSGTARAVEGGFVLTGRWSFSSGSDHCDWVFVGANVIPEDGGSPAYRHFLLKRGEYEIVDVWHVAGLSSTGSNDIVVSEQFVPEPRTMLVSDLAALRCPGRVENTAPLYSVPWGAVFLNAVCVPLVGMARAALDLCAEYHRAKVGYPALTNPGAMPSDVTLARLGEASSDVDAAWLQLQHNLGVIYEHAVAGTDIPVEYRAKARRDQITSVMRAVSAVDKAYESSGPRAIKLANPLQRIWRDAHAAQHHVVNLPDGLASYGAYMITGRIEDSLV